MKPWPFPERVHVERLEAAGLVHIVIHGDGRVSLWPDQVDALIHELRAAAEDVRNA